MATQNNVSKNYTLAEIEEYLSMLQEKSTLAFIPTLVYLSLLIVVGSIGNSLVLVVYSTKMFRTPLRVFIMSMAVFDLLINILIIPGEIYDMFHIWTFQLPVECQIRMYLNGLLVFSSAFLLVAIATTRYKMVCRPFEKQVSLTQSKYICGLVVLISSVISIPHGLIHGSQTRKTPEPNIEGHYCQVDDSYYPTVWPTLNSAFFVLLFVSCSSVIIYFYICIGNTSWRQSKHFTTNKNNLVTRTVINTSEISTSMIDEDEITSPSLSDKGQTKDGCISSDRSLCDRIEIEKVQRLSKETRDNSNIYKNVEMEKHGNKIDVYSNRDTKQSVNVTDVSKSQLNNKQKNRYQKVGSNRTRSLFGKTSLMMLTVTLVFFIGFLPFLALNVFAAISPDTVSSLTGVALSFYQLFLYSYFLNSAANPIIYSLLDRKFKNECSRLFKYCHVIQSNVQN
ncbi:uncharacterized protein LOC106067079 isoform X1 [Biomphalaria glabrata]|uniref:Uncharacterized protein LOC106067079 isoform X1 n=1 Tax=Biomphalaria glabrata TaxID=6526 RepID=A0A9W3BE55_BIOGL|nr:uncharacterized protein LOC106067079 isoform X1 [Biomphalaria glabrata]XP_055897709.1 uncharacterized protein LOC106067079 isoform X1 [Biomphalaria glabrata]XP_055897711.1 uncharacterized protein LOC106067079 isoform X1 [Biomphalaria glabrata]XP_055897712.1 uncharacterized protein LOC106067079 isoform X1 [Biomphalaria glabrata]XP_055897713.1 uncharacterized protein LOC106067079 isoform X1 [Biomphalaria glabrata]